MSDPIPVLQELSAVPFFPIPDYFLYCIFIHNIFLFFFSILHLYPHFSFPPFSQKKPQPQSDPLMQSDQQDEPKKHSKKDRKGKKNKKKRDRGSKGKGKGKGKGRGRKGSRKRKHEEEGLEDGFLRVSTKLPEYQSQEPFQPTELPEITNTAEAVISTEAYDKTLMEMPTHEPDFTTEAPSVVPSALPESKVTEEVDQFPCRCPSIPHQLHS